MKNAKLKPAMLATAMPAPESAAGAGVEDILRLANTMMDNGRLDLAQEILLDARNTHPKDARIANNLGLCNLRAGQARRAKEDFRAALRLKPNYFGATVNLGQSALALGDLQLALDCFVKAERHPDGPSGEVLKAKAQVLRQLDRPDEAAAVLEAVVSAAPQDQQARIDLGVLYCKRQDFAAGTHQFVAVLETDPENFLALYNLGLALEAQGFKDKAKQCFHAALQRNPRHFESLNALGVMQLAAEDLDEAEKTFETLLELNPNDIAVANLANCQFQSGKYLEATQNIAKAVALQPDNEDFRSAAVYYNIYACNWDGVRRNLAACPDLGIHRQPIAPFTLLAAEDDPERQKGRSVLWAGTIRPPVSAAFSAPPPHPEGKIRIGYFSNDFYNHATMHLLSGLLREHDRSRFEITLFSYGRQFDDPMRRLAITYADQFLNVSDSTDAEIVQMARHLELDVAVDLKGHTKHARLGFFASRMAPVHMTYLGYPGTSGAAFFDYAICDPVVLPPHERAGFTEQIVYLPDCYQANDDQRQVPVATTRRTDWGLPEAAPVICCFNHNYKIGETEFDIWMRALARRDDAVLWLLKSNDVARENLLKRAEAAGVGRERVIFAETVSPSANIERLRHADLFVDTFNYNAHTTGSDALWAGVPILTRAGRQFSARVGASLLSAAGLPEFITDTAEAYEARLHELLRDPARLDAAHRHLQSNRKTLPLFDTVPFTRHIEDGYVRALERCRSGLPPSDIHVRKRG